jgi:hypothetical protein
MAKKDSLIARLKGEEVKADKKAFTARFDSELFGRIEKIAANSKDPKLSINEVINTLIELGLAEFDKA